MYLLFFFLSLFFLTASCLAGVFIVCVFASSSSLSSLPSPSPAVVISDSEWTESRESYKRKSRKKKKERVYDIGVKLTEMSYYFSIIGTQDNPLFEHEFGTFRHSGDGLARFPTGDGLPLSSSTDGNNNVPTPTARQMNQLIVHASLDVLEEEQWKGGNMCV